MRFNQWINQLLTLQYTYFGIPPEQHYISTDKWPLKGQSRPNIPHIFYLQHKSSDLVSLRHIWSDIHKAWCWPEIWQRKIKAGKWPWFLALSEWRPIVGNPFIFCYCNPHIKWKLFECWYQCRHRNQAISRDLTKMGVLIRFESGESQLNSSFYKKVRFCTFS